MGGGGCHTATGGLMWRGVGEGVRAQVGVDLEKGMQALQQRRQWEGEGQQSTSDCVVCAFIQ